MMALLSNDYPQGMSNNEIKKAIQEYSNEIHKSKANINKILQLTPLIQLGQSELQERNNRIIARLSIGVSFISLFIAFVALYVSYNSSQTSTKLETQQIEILSSEKELFSNFAGLRDANEKTTIAILEKINNKLVQINSYLDTLNNQKTNVK